jgi:hypothetical protein
MALNSEGVVRRVLHLDIEDDAEKDVDMASANIEESTPSAQREKDNILQLNGDINTSYDASSHDKNDILQLNGDTHTSYDARSHGQASVFVERVQGGSPEESDNKESSLNLVVREGGSEDIEYVEIYRKDSDPIMLRGQVNESESIDQRKQRILGKRGAFSWLPVYFQSDLELGAWWFTAASFLTILIPMFPLISLWQGFWPDAEKANGNKLLPNTAHATAFAFLMLAGVFYTTGSWLFVRAFQDPVPPPLFDWHPLITSSDELLGVWLFLLGTLPSVPVMLIYVIYNPYSAEFILAYIICLFANAVLCVVVYSCLPDNVFRNGGTRINILSPCFQNFFSKNSPIQVHIQNDWLLSIWMMLIFCVMSVIMCIGQLIHYCSLHYKRGIYDYSAALVDCVMFMIGTMYFIAGK